jgi:hypothetical protein
MLSEPNRPQQAPYRWAKCWCPHCEFQHIDLIYNGPRLPKKPPRQICDDCLRQRLLPAAWGAYVRRKAAVAVANPGDRPADALSARPVRRSE